MGRCCRSHKVNASVLLPLLEELQIISVFICLRMMATNYIGAFSLRKLLLQLLRNSHVPSSRVVFDKDSVTGVYSSVMLIRLLPFVR
ncbi:hypothetical protein YC2023_059734 [Brassica napus]